MGTDQAATMRLAVLTTGVACCLAYVVFKVVPNVMARYRNYTRKTEVTEVDGLDAKPPLSEPQIRAENTPSLSVKPPFSEPQISAENTLSLSAEPIRIKRTAEPVTSEEPVRLLSTGTPSGDDGNIRPQKEEVKVEAKMTDPTLDYPFLTDQETTNYIQRSNIMFIMRGLPGSGKSYVAEMIKETYSDSIVCSADDFRIVNGQYIFNPENLQKDHAKCHALAKQCCERNNGVVVIDNTNVRSWEFRYYLDLANQKNYTVIMVEPKTPWKFDADELARRNKHGVAYALLKKKVHSFEMVIPLFFGWFLNYDDSGRVRKLGQEIYRNLQQIPEFVQGFKMRVYGDPKASLNFISYFSAESFVVGTHMLHCTAKFCARGKIPDSYTYANHAEVQQSLGKAYVMQVIGFFVTPRTRGVRLKLSPQQKRLWGQEDAKEYVLDTEAAINRHISAAKNRKGYGGMYNDRQNDGPVMSWQKKGASPPDEENLTQSDGVNKFAPTSGIGSRAHLTLACAKGSTAMQTGIDLVDIIHAEEEAMETKDANVTLMLPIQGGTLRCYDNKAWMVYLDEPISMDALFSGFY